MLLFEGVYADAVDKIRSVCDSHKAGLLLVGLIGSEASGRTSVCHQALHCENVKYESHQMIESSWGSVHDFLTWLNNCGDGVFSDYDDLSSDHKSAFSDFVMSVKLGLIAACPSKVWLVPSRSELPFADFNVHVPDLQSSPGTRRLVCDKLLNGFPCDPKCPVSDVLFHSVAKLSIGNLAAVVRNAKLLAVSDGVGLSCEHLSSSFHSLVLPCETVPRSPSPNMHSCAIVFRAARNSSLDDFIGLSDEHRARISDFVSTSYSSRILLISGPVGCGKTHLGSAVCWSSSDPFLRVSSADILQAKIGESEKRLFKVLSSHSRILIEDIDKLFPADSRDATGSVQRCLPVLKSFMDRRGEFGSDRILLGTTRNLAHVSPLLANQIELIELSNQLSFPDKVKLIRTEFRAFDDSGVVKPFDLIHLDNRAKCVLYGRDLKLDLLRKAVS